MEEVQLHSCMLPCFHPASGRHGEQLRFEQKPNRTPSVTWAYIRLSKQAVEHYSVWEKNTYIIFFTCNKLIKEGAHPNWWFIFKTNLTLCKQVPAVSGARAHFWLSGVVLKPAAELPGAVFLPAVTTPTASQGHPSKNNWYYRGKTQAKMRFSVFLGAHSSLHCKTEGKYKN